MPVRIVSVNAWGGALYDALVPWLQKLDADVVCLQEMTRTPGVRDWTQFEDEARTLPQRADLMTDVARALPGHAAWFTASDSGPVRGDDRAVHRQDFGLGLFVREDLAQVNARAEHVHGTYVDHGRAWPHSDRPRAAQVVRLHDPVAARFVTIGHLHGLRDAAGKQDTPARREQAKRLAGLVQEVREPADLVVVCGDLNLLPDSETFTTLADIGLTDLVGDADTRTAHYKKALRHASYLLVSDPADVIDFEIVAYPEVSDHRPLLVEL